MQTSEAAYSRLCGEIMADLSESIASEWVSSYSDPTNHCHVGMSAVAYFPKIKSEKCGFLCMKCLYAKTL